MPIDPVFSPRCMDCPREIGRNIGEVLRAVEALQTTDASESPGWKNSFDWWFACRDL